MAEQGASADAIARIEQAAAELRIPNTELTSVPKQLADIVAREGLQTSIGPIRYAGQYADGQNTVAYEDQNGYQIGPWPPWAFEVAKEALLANKRVWVVYTEAPLSDNLISVTIMRV
jgi:hypothetical protein